MCREQGRCGLRDQALDERCLVVNEDDCLKSSGCKKYGKCHRVRTWCAATTEADCRNSKYCAEEGLCQVRDGECIAGSDKDCMASARCKSKGACSRHRRGYCDKFVARSEADCRDHDNCRTMGRCFLRGGSCVALTDHACEKTTNCELFGDCGYDATNKACVPTRKQHCLRSKQCPPYCVTGKNVAGYPKCKATSAQACTSAKACDSPPCIVIDGRCASHNDPDAKTAREIIDTQK